MLAMHVPNSDIHTLLRFPVPPLTFISPSQDQKKCLLVFVSLPSLKNRVV